MSLVKFDGDDVEFHATSSHIGGSTGRFNPKRAFLPSKFFDGKRFWQSAKEASLPQILYFRFKDTPRALSQISFQACSDSECTKEARQTTGPKSYDIVAAMECDGNGEDASWTVIATEPEKSWAGSSPAIHDIKGETVLRVIQKV